jgi:hypothetical protein
VSFSTFNSSNLRTRHNALVPCRPLASSMAVVTQRDAEELLPLLDVVGIRGSSRFADAAGHLFNGGEVPSFALVQPVVHAFV